MRQTMPGNRGVDDGLHVVEDQLDLDYDLQIGAFLFIFLGKNCAAGLRVIDLKPDDDRHASVDDDLG